MSDDSNCDGGHDGDDWNGGQDDGHDDCHGGEDGYHDGGCQDGDHDYDDAQYDDGCRGDGGQEFDGQQGVDDGGSPNEQEADPRHFDYRYTQDQLGEWVYNEGGHDDKNERHGQQDGVGVERDSNQGGHGIGHRSDNRHEQQGQQCDDQGLNQDGCDGRHQQEDGQDDGLYIPPHHRDFGQDQCSDEQGRGYRDFGTYSTKGVYSDCIESVRCSPGEYQRGDHEEERRYELLRLWNKEHDPVYEDRDRWWPTADELEVHNETGCRGAFDRDKEMQRAIVNGHDLDEDRLDVIQWLKDARDLDSCVRSKQD